MNVPLVFKRMLLLLISIATLTIVTSAFAQNVINIHPDHVGASNPGFQTGECPVDGWGWHYVLPGQSEFEDIHVRYQNAGWIHGGISDPTPKHMYQVTPGPDVILEAWAVINGDATRFNLSHVCTGSPLNPIKIIKFLDKNGNGVQDPGEP